MYNSDKTTLSLIPGCTNIFPDPRLNDLSSEPGSTALECKGGGNGSTPRKHADKHDSHVRRSGSETAGYRARIAVVGGEHPNHCATAAPFTYDWPWKEQTQGYFSPPPLFLIAGNTGREMDTRGGAEVVGKGRERKQRRCLLSRVFGTPARQTNSAGGWKAALAESRTGYLRGKLWPPSHKPPPPTTTTLMPWRQQDLTVSHEIARDFTYSRTISSCRGMNIVLVEALSRIYPRLEDQRKRGASASAMGPWQLGCGDYPQLVASTGSKAFGNIPIPARGLTGRCVSAVVVDVGNLGSSVRDGEAHLLEVAQRSRRGGGSRAILTAGFCGLRDEWIGMHRALEASPMSALAPGLTTTAGWRGVAPPLAGAAFAHGVCGMTELSSFPTHSTRSRGDLHPHMLSVLQCWFACTAVLTVVKLQGRLRPHDDGHRRGGCSVPRTTHQLRSHFISPRIKPTEYLRYTQCKETTARQLRVLCLVAMMHLMREAVSPLLLMRLSASRADRKLQPGGQVGGIPSRDAVCDAQLYSATCPLHVQEARWEITANFGRLQTKNHPSTGQLNPSMLCECVTNCKRLLESAVQLRGCTHRCSQTDRANRQPGEICKGVTIPLKRRTELLRYTLEEWRYLEGSRAEEDKVRRVWSSARMQEREKRGIPEKTHQPVQFPSRKIRERPRRESNSVRLEQRHDGNTARRSDEALRVRVSVARIAETDKLLCRENDEPFENSEKIGFGTAWVTLGYQEKRASQITSRRGVSFLVPSRYQPAGDRPTGYLASRYLPACGPDSSRAVPTSDTALSARLRGDYDRKTPRQSCGEGCIAADGLTLADNARLHRRSPKLDLRSTQKTVAPFELRAGLEIEMQRGFLTPSYRATDISNVNTHSSHGGGSFSMTQLAMVLIHTINMTALICFFSATTHDVLLAVASLEIAKASPATCPMPLFGSRLRCRQNLFTHSPNALEVTALMLTLDVFHLFI
ncbi:hypothetical protein PR048_016888 [Dryococelus australis]|uniref:Uncharacterized protein n=1 Tax=Dryococelus australis TaxID=614101 RepID=A0ABQ9H7Z6_9NEOP|nr:hypothetical protein PR048_016888 [Dryococelus australis]